jgi:uncharacterized protein YbjT (DUF2867 family)
MKVLVLGGSGFVGGHLARRLSRDGHQLTIVTRYAPGCRHLAVVPGVTIRQFDPCDGDELARRLEGHDAAINLVGILNERVFGGGRGFRRAHVELVETLINACVRTGVRRLIHMSALNAGQGESQYLETRGEAEQLVGEVFRQGHIDTTIVRPSTIFGPDDSFLNRFVGLLKISPVLPLARPQARFAPVYVGDVVEGFARMLARRGSHGKVHELCGSEQWTLIELVRWLRDQLGLKRAVIGLPDAIGRLQGLAFDVVPGKPFSTDNFKSLLVDSVCAQDGFAELDIRPWGMSELAPTWLGDGARQRRYQRYRSRARRDRE